MRVASLINKYWTSPQVKQVVSLYSVNLVSIPLGIVSSVIMTRNLTPDQYGSYKYVLSLCNLLATLVTFGFFQAGSRALLLNDDKEKARQIYGAEIILTAIMSLFMSLSLFIISFYENDPIVKKAIYIIIPFCFVFLVTRITDVMLRADNKVSLIVQYKILTPILEIVAVVVLFYVIRQYRVDYVILLSMIGQLICVAYLVIKMNISFKSFSDIYKEIWYYNKTYGFHVYLGAIAGIGFAQLTPVFVGIFGVNNSGVGYYSLAATIASPLAMIPVSIATVKYRDFSKYAVVPRKILILTIAITLAAYLCMCFLVYPFVMIFYGESYSSVILLSIVIGIGTVIHGMGDFYNYYFSAKGLGKQIKNTAIIVGFGSLVANLLFIPFFNEYGAAYTKIFCGCLYLGVMLLYYSKSIKHS